MSTMALQLPNSFVDVERDEMEYVDGGLGLPNWFVGGAINLAITAMTGGSAGAAAGFFRGLASKYGQARAAVMFSNSLRSQLLAKGIGAGVASGICSLVSGAFTVLLWATDPGSQLAKAMDARDCKPNNGWVDIS